MMNFSLKHLFVFLLFSSSLNGQSFFLDVIEESGKDLPFKPKTSHASVFERRDALRTYILRLQDDGFLAAGVDSLSGDETKQTAHIYLGQKFNWSSLYPLDVDGAALSAAGYKNRLYSDRPFRLASTKKMMRKILRYYENHGYPFAKVRFDSLENKEGYLKAGIRVEKGELIKIDSLTIRGDAKITNRYLYNYIGIEPGDLYNESLLASLSTRLKELPFITEQRPAEVFLLDEAALIRLYLKTRKASNFNGIIGFLPNNQETGKLLLTGEANLRLKNSLGRGESIIAEWRRL
ncbi:MAG: hypothetical protein WED33_05720, partial [Bacteroidia bacterium]